MEILHRISVASSSEIRGELADLGIAIEADGFAVFDVAETDPAWPQLQAWIRKRQASDVASTKFAKSEIEGAAWVTLEPTWHCGYPQPNELEFGYLKATYDLTEYCDRCGIGKKQKAPFQLKKEPAWNGKGILQLHWVFDEFFTTPDVWAE